MKHNRFYRLLSLLLTAALCVGLCLTPALAADAEPEELPSLPFKSIGGDNTAFGTAWESLDGEGLEAWQNDAVDQTNLRTLLNSLTLHPQRTGWAELDIVIENLLKTTGGTDTYDRLKGVYDWLVYNVTYSWTGYSKTTAPAYEYFTRLNYLTNMHYETGLQKSIPDDMANRAYHVLTQKKGVCYDYAIAFAVLARYIGIDAYVHTGYFTFENTSMGRGHHGWNVLNLGGTNYLFDSQRDARNREQNYGNNGYYFGVRNTWRYTSLDTAKNAARDASMLSVAAARTAVVTANYTGSGTVTGGGTYNIGQSVTVTATPASGYTFAGWYDAGGNRVSSDNPYTFTLPGCVTLSASFTLTPYNVNVIVEGAGTVTGGGAYTVGQTAVLRAYPEPGSRFFGWYDRKGNLLTTADACQFSVAGNTTIYARFGVTVTTRASASGTVTGGGDYITGAVATLTAEGELTGWYDALGNLLSTDNPYEFSADADTEIIAMFEGDRFIDVPKGIWYEKYVEEAAQRKLVSGMTAITFEPDTLFTRAMVAAILGRIEGADVKAAPVSNFEDVDQSMWYAPYINWAYDNKVVYGITDTEFQPNAPVTREQLMAMLVRYLERVRGLTLEEAEVDYTDQAAISEYAVPYIRKAEALNLISGYEDGTFQPLNDLPRREGVTFMMRMVHYLDSIAPEEEPPAADE